MSTNGFTKFSTQLIEIEIEYTTSPASLGGWRDSPIIFQEKESPLEMVGATNEKKVARRPAAWL